MNLFVGEEKVHIFLFRLLQNDKLLHSKHYICKNVIFHKFGEERWNVLAKKI